MDLHSRNWFIITFSSMLDDYTEEELGLVYDSLGSWQLDFIKDACNCFYSAGYKAAEEDSM